MESLIPGAGPITVDEMIGSWRPAAEAPEGRPFVAANMVTTLDGRAAIGGGSTGLGSEADSELLVKLRRRFDAVLVGAGTIRAERYGPIVRDEDARRAREAEGMEPSPVAVILSGSMDLPYDCGLFTEGIGRVVVFTDSDLEPPPTETPVEVIRPSGALTARVAIEELARMGVRSVLCEGGPTVLAGLIEGDVLDELFLTVFPLITGEADQPSIVEGPVGGDGEPREFHLHSLAAEGGELFARYRPRR